MKFTGWSGSGKRGIGATILLFLGVSAIAAGQDRDRPEPTHRDVAYGPHERNVVDFYQARSDAPAPVLVYFHGGGFRGGDKRGIDLGLYRLCMESGISVAAANYRLTQHAPYPAQMHDSARAIQFLRSRAEAWNVDPDRLAAYGGSAGAGISLWLAFHDDMRETASGDPVARQSTRLSCAIGLGAQSTYDPREIRAIVPGRACDHPALRYLFAVPEDFDWDKAEIDEALSAKMQDASPMTHLTKDDPPALVYHNTEQDRPGDIHHGNFGRVLKERMDALGIESVRRMSDDYEDASARNNALFAFVKRHFRMGADAAVSKEVDGSLLLELRSRSETAVATKEDLLVRTVRWNPRGTSIIVCDMWDDHTCKGAARRVAAMAPALDRAIKAARKKGVLIIHAPSGTVSAYEETPQRRRAVEAPFSRAKVDIKWNHWNPEREGEPLAFIRSGACGCAEPCAGWVEEGGQRQWKGGKSPWTRQIETIEIAPGDAVSDSGEEIYNLLEQRGIGNVILMGVHTNICVSGRPFGLRQMVYHGKNVVLCRDLTDAFFQSASPDVDQLRGTRLVVEHIERRLCPTITSASITGEPAFRFEGDPEQAKQ